MKLYQDNTPIVDGADVLKRIADRQQPLKDIQAFYDQRRIEEEKLQAERIAEMEKNMKPIKKTTDEKLLEAIQALTEQLKGESK